MTSFSVVVQSHEELWAETHFETLKEADGSPRTPRLTSTASSGPRCGKCRRAEIGRTVANSGTTSSASG